MASGAGSRSRRRRRCRSSRGRAWSAGSGETFWLGSHRYLVERGQETGEVVERAAALEREGHTVVVIGNERHVCGLIAVADTVRPEARP